MATDECSKCKKQIDLEASVCPYCQSAFDDEVMTARRSSHKDKLKSAGCGCLILFTLSGLLGMCIGPKAPDENVEQNESVVVKKGSGGVEQSASQSVKSSVGDTNTARLEAEKSFPKEALPQNAPAAPVSIVCAEEFCEVKRVEFANRDWPRAWRGDYQGQRNAAYCRSTGCDGAVLLDKIEGCAWRFIINMDNAAKADQSDSANFKNECGRLDAVDLDLAARKADTYHALIAKNKPRQ
jgi:hypothetical protein